MSSKEKMFQYFAWGICTVLAIALVLLVFNDKKRNQERIVQAKMEMQNKSENNEVIEVEKNEHTRNVTRAYEDLISKLKLSAFVCWGDIEMVGNEDASLPKAFENEVNGHLQELLSTSFGEVYKQKVDDVPSITVSRMGVSNEGINELLVRAGVDELEVGEWALISEEREPITLVLRNSNSGSTLHFALQKDARIGQVEISGVKGVLDIGDGEYDENHPKLAFIRDKAGDSFQVGLGTDIEIESATKYIGNIPVFFFEDDTADTVGSVDKFVSDLERLVHRYTEIEEEDGEPSRELPYVVICTADEETELDESLKEAFGDCYIRHNTYVDDMTEEDYKDLAQKVYANLDGQGCFDEMKAMIAKSIEELKDS